jgi:magnesium transporter
MQSFELDKSDILKIRRALEQEDSVLKELVAEYHPSEIAKLFESLSQESRERIISVLPAEIASEVIAEMDPEFHPERLLENLHPERRSEIVEELDYDDATDIISQLPEEQQQEILMGLDEEDASNIRSLLKYDDDTAGGLMNTQVIKISQDLLKKDALELIIQQSEEMEEFYTINVIDEHNILKGIVSLKDIIKARNNVRIEEIIKSDFVYVKADTDQISGVSEDEELAGNWREAVKSRLPWLILNLGTAFLAASVIRYFDSSIARMGILAGYMVMIAGMGGNAATQALAVTIRRISLTDLTDNQAYRTVLKEFTVGLINGASIGFIIFLFALFYDGNPMLGLVIFVAMTGNLIIAGMAGSSIPLILKRVGIDPAIASSIIITTFTDVFGFLLLLGLASKLLL